MKYSGEQQHKNKFFPQAVSSVSLKYDSSMQIIVTSYNFNTLCVNNRGSKTCWPYFTIFYCATIILKKRMLNGHPALELKMRASYYSTNEILRLLVSSRTCLFVHSLEEVFRRKETLFIPRTEDHIIGRTVKLETSCKQIQYT